MTTNKHSVIIKFNKYDPSIEETNIQHLPFNLLYNGFARVSNYLKIDEKQSNNKTQLYSSFRGVKLVGERLELPQGFNGYIFRDENQDSTDIDDNINNESSSSVNKQWETISKFNNLTYWNRETLPSDFDKPVQALKSLNILSIINKEITNEEIQNEIDSNKVNNKGSSNSTTNSTPTKTITTTTTTTITTNNSNSPSTAPTKSKIATIQKSNGTLVEDMDFDLDENDHKTILNDNDENEEENKRKQKKLKK